jgi:hypothetical protein
MGICVNFFWAGDNFDYINYMCIQSHVKVGHQIIIWLYGEIPDSQHWYNLDFSNIIVIDASDIFDISSFMKHSDANFRTASALWRFTFLYKYGGWYSDCDAFAIKEWPNSEWVLCSGEEDEDLLSIGVLKTPPKEEMFLDMIDNIQHKWGNVKVFNTYLRKHKDHTIKPYNPTDFYPFSWKDWDYMLSNIDIPDTYSVHLYNTMVQRNMNDIKGFIDERPNSLLGKLDKSIL